MLTTETRGITERFPERLRQLMADRDTDASTLSTRTGVDVESLLNGSTEPTWSDVVTLAVALQCHIGQLHQDDPNGPVPCEPSTPSEQELLATMSRAVDIARRLRRMFEGVDAEKWREYFLIESLLSDRWARLDGITPPW